MDLSVAQVPTARALRLDGELDLATIDRLTGLLAEPVAAGGPIVVDMTSLRFMDSMGIGALARAALELEKNGWCLYLHTTTVRSRRP